MPTLCQVLPAHRMPKSAGPPIHHLDLYRLKGPEECQRLALADTLTSSVALVEWPEVLGPHYTPAEHLHVNLRQTEQVRARCV